MYEDLLRELRCCPDAEYGCSRCKHRDSLHCRETLMQESADAIEKLKEELPKWISVKERLPKTDEYVIVAICDDSGDSEYRYTTVGFYIKMQFEGVWVVDNERNSGVTHWMPLPEPPKEGGDGMIISELHLEEEPKPHKCSCGATPRITYNGLLWVVECPKCFNIESGWTALGVINAWNRRVDREGGGEDV